VADLRSRFLEDYAGGLLNVARQDLSSTGEVLAQDGFVDSLTYFVEDGRGVKSGLRLGSSLAECVDPVTEQGVLNIRTADRTYAKIRELKIFATAVASAQGALSQSVAESFINFEGAFESLESDFADFREQFLLDINRNTLAADNNREEIQKLASITTTNSENIVTLASEIELVQNDVELFKQSKSGAEFNLRTGSIEDGESAEFNIQFPLFYGVISIESDLPAWITLYSSELARNQDLRVDDTTTAGGVVVDAVTTLENTKVSYLPLPIAYSDNGTVFVRVVNQAGSDRNFNIKLRYVAV